MSNHQAIITALAKVQGEKVANCDACSGGGIVYYIHGCGTCGTPEKSPEICNCPPCPSCAEVRALDADFKLWAEVLTWTSNTMSLTTEQYKIDGKPQGKLWIVHCLMTLGKWEEFVRWAENMMPQVELIVRLKIFTDGKLLVPVIEEYLKEREG